MLEIRASSIVEALMASSLARQRLRLPVARRHGVLGAVLCALSGHCEATPRTPPHLLSTLLDAQGPFREGRYALGWLRQPPLR
jgi:hypothetical protein